MQPLDLLIAYLLCKGRGEREKGSKAGPYEVRITSKTHVCSSERLLEKIYRVQCFFYSISFLQARGSLGYTHPSPASTQNSCIQSLQAGGLAMPVIFSLRGVVAEITASYN